MYPRPDFDLPILSLDLVAGEGGRVPLAIIDPCPVSRSLQLPPHYLQGVRWEGGRAGGPAGRRAGGWAGGAGGRACVRACVRACGRAGGQCANAMLMSADAD